MQDTSKHIQEKFYSMLMQKSGKERLMMGFSMYDTAVELIKASLPKDISEQEQRVAIFKRLYQNDFSKQEIQKIVQHLRKQT